MYACTILHILANCFPSLFRLHFYLGFKELKKMYKSKNITIMHWYSSEQLGNVFYKAEKIKQRSRIQIMEWLFLIC